jgi:hypothetical protein
MWNALSINDGHFYGYVQLDLQGLPREQAHHRVGHIEVFVGNKLGANAEIAAPA